jgi:hypothetical protein
MAQDPEHRRRFEMLLYLAAQRGDADLMAERLSWGIDPNHRLAKGRLLPSEEGPHSAQKTFQQILNRRTIRA